MTGSQAVRDADLAALVAELRRIGTSAGLDAVGIAPAEPFAGTRRHLEDRRAEGLHGGMQFTYRNPSRSTDPDQALAGAAALVVGARSYLRATPPKPPGSAGPVGRIARYSWCDHYEPLRQALGSVADRLSSDGWRARVLADDNALVDREAAYRAGLGWYGKNTNLLLPGRGSWHVLGSVVTDAPLPPDQPIADGCGACERCLTACPTGAFIRPGVLDARRCLAWLVQAPGVFPLEHRAALGDRIYGCDACQEVCPVNVVSHRRTPPPPADPDDEAITSLLAVLAATDEELLARFGRWYIPQREPRYLRRNALVALGNTADGFQPAVVAAVRRALADPDPLLRAHAVWAAARMGRPDLLGAVVDDRHPAVRAELAAAREVHATTVGTDPTAAAPI
ncbi:MAG TPA: tRNA epoxyqueuosine(34) reductase QueG [Acidimicrobiales bacterium]|nr:tRNA epoxyqueuosine(34) reductase QueG [Acidimicrobiales bacterium]